MTIHGETADPLGDNTTNGKNSDNEEMMQRVVVCRGYNTSLLTLA